MRKKPSASPSIQTSGEIFSTGEVLELVAPQAPSDALALLLWKDNRAAVKPRIKLGGRTYVPLSLDPGIPRAIRFASGVSAHGSLPALFRRMAEAIKSRSDLTERGIKTACYWALATWFPDLLLAAPSLSIASVSPALASCFLNLLRAFCRRGVRLAELNQARLCGLPIHLQPTLLVDQTAINRNLGGVLRASCSRGQYIPTAGGFRDIHCAKAVFCAGKALEPALLENMLTIALTPRGSSLGILDERQLDELAREFQPQLMDYRLRNFQRVRDCTFDVPTFTPGLRILARSLGAAVCGDEQLTADLVVLLSPMDSDIRARRGALPECAIVTVGLALLHGQRPKAMLTSEFAALVNAALRSNGEITEHSPEEVGWMLSRLGLFTKRMPGGRGLRFDRDFSKLVHTLAKEFEVTMTPGAFPGCPDCDHSPQPTETKSLMHVL